MTSPQPHPAAIEIDGTFYLRDAKGSLVPIALIKPTDLLMDEQVRAWFVQARALSAAIAGFKTGAFAGIAALQELLAQEYNATLGGAKGNVSILSFDGLMRVQLQVSDRIEFGAELQVAKTLIDECLTEWSKDGPVELKAIVNRAFSVDQQGKINRTELFMLLRSEIQDPRWLKAMQAIRDSMRVVGSKSYLRFYERDTHDGAWRAVSLDIATV